jgi:hypothetical protein
MNQVLGLGVTAVSIMLAAIVSGFRLKPYLDAGEKYTPLSFAVYPLLIAGAIAVPVVLLVRWWQGKSAVDIGAVTLSDRQPFIVLWCVLYVVVAVAFFPYQPPPKPQWPSQPPAPKESETPNHPTDVRLPLFGRNVPVYPDRQPL